MAGGFRVTATIWFAYLSKYLVVALAVISDMQRAQSREYRRWPKASQECARELHKGTVAINIFDKQSGRKLTQCLQITNWLYLGGGGGG